jgi:N-acetylmuramoyl-L-alanine amidase
MHRLGTVFVVAAAALAVVVSSSASQGTVETAGVAPKPRIVWKPIPFPASRKAEMAAYAKRHYGLDSWRLVRPRVIVEHYTASTTFSSAYWTFVSDAPDAELHERPGICAHFVIDTDGTIYQLVSLAVMCRHTVGLNYTAIGIEHVGTSDRGVLDNRAQMRSSLALTSWLVGRYHVQLGDVIGHNESLTSPFHKELYPGWRCQTHGDFPRAAMDEYRARLAKVARAAGVPLGRSTHRVATTC